MKANPHRDYPCIEPCLCGNPFPEVSGDDFDGEVDCSHCLRDIFGFGTRGAINIWNRRIAAYRAGTKEFPRVFPHNLTEANECADKLQQDADGFSREGLPGIAEIMRTAAIQILEATATARQALLAMEPAFHPSDPDIRTQSAQEG